MVDNNLKKIGFWLLCGFFIFKYSKPIRASEDICRLITKSENINKLVKLEENTEIKHSLSDINCYGKNLLEVALANSLTLDYVSDIRPGRYDNISWLLDRRFSVTQKDTYGNTPLHLVAKKGDINLIYLLVEKGADINEQNDNGKTPLHMAVLSNPKAFNLLLHLGADYIIQDNYGNTPLRDAIHFKEVEVVKILLQHGVLPSRELFYDAKQNTKEGKINRTEASQIVSLIEEYQELRTKAILQGANLEKLSFNPPPIPSKQLLPSKADPAIVKATRANDINTVRKLISAGADLDAISKFGGYYDNEYEYNATSLHIALYSGYVEIARLLIESGANVTIQSGAGYHPLYLAASNLELTELLLTKGASVDRQTARFNQTALMADILSIEVAKLLLRKGADINYQSKFGYTALHKAIEIKNTSLVMFLLNHDINIHLANYNNETPLYHAVIDNQPKIVKLLLNSGAKTYLDELYEISLIKDYQEIEVILKQAGADYQDQNRLFEKAVKQQNIGLVRRLLNEGVDNYLKTKKGAQVLYDVGTNYELMELLLKKGADVNVTNKERKTPLYFASKFGQSDIVKLLLQYSADVTVKDEDGINPLYMAVNAPIYLLRLPASDGPYPNFDKDLPPYLKIIKLLLNAGSDVEIETKYGTLDELIQNLRNNQNEEVVNFAKEVILLLEKQ